MGDYIKRVSNQVGDFLKELSPGKRASIAVVGSAISIAMLLMFFWAGDKSFNSLMSNLNPEDAANIMRILREKKIPFRVDESGRNISVPPESVDLLRLELATVGLPQSSIVGYEVFDKQSIGTTSFVQKVNQKRALEGELMRTIGSIKGVKRSRVHLAVPQKSTFVEDQKKPTASVVLELEAGTQLSDKQIFGIGNLVAKGVEGMDVSDVVIVDAMGKTLSKNNGDALAQATTTQLDFRQKMEQDMEKRVEQMLARVVGDGRVVARVSADLDFSQTAETQTTYDSDGAAVISTQKNNANSDMTRPGPAGAVGAKSNLPDATNPQPAAPLAKTNTNQNADITNYRVPETVRRTQKAAGTVRKLSVAVMIDGKKTKTTDDKGVTTTKVEPWAPERVKEFEQMVASAVGLDKKRGDTLEIKNMEFTGEDFEEAQKLIQDSERRMYIQNIIVYAVIALTIVLFFMFVVRPFIKWITENTLDSVESYLPQTIEELEKMQKNATIQALEESIPELQDRIDPEKVEGEMIKEKIVSLVDANPHKAALILRDWLHLEAKKNAEEGAPGGKGAGKGKAG